MSSRGMIAARQRNINYRPTNQVAAHVLASTITAPQLKGEVIHMRTGRAFVVNGLAVAKGQMCALVQSTVAEGRYYVCHGGQWSTSDERVVAKLRAAILKHAA